MAKKIIEPLSHPWPKYSAFEYRVLAGNVLFDRTQRAEIKAALVEFPSRAVAAFILSLEDESAAFCPWPEEQPLPTPRRRVEELRIVSELAQKLAARLDQQKGSIGADWTTLNGLLPRADGGPAIERLRTGLCFLGAGAVNVAEELARSPRWERQREGHKSRAHQLAYRVASLMQSALQQQPTCTWPPGESLRASPYMKVLSVCYRAWTSATSERRGRRSSDSLSASEKLRNKLVPPARKALAVLAQEGKPARKKS